MFLSDICHSKEKVTNMIDKVWYTYTTEDYSTIKNKIMSFAGRGIKLNKKCQMRKDKCYMFTLTGRI
jgi:hypothetical protein